MILVRLRKSQILRVSLFVLFVCILMIVPPEPVRILAAFIEGEPAVPVPAIMYHSIVRDKSLVNDYVVTEKTFENDLKYIKEMGYEAVTISDLIDYVYNDGKLPEKPILLTFDDGCYNHYSIVYPLLKKYNMKGVFSIIGYYIDKFSVIKDNNDSYSYMTWDQVKELSESGIVEIGNHSYNMHKNGSRRGVANYKGEDIDHYREVLINDVVLLRDKIKTMTGYDCMTFTYPFGAYTHKTQQLMKELGFKSTLSCREGMNLITRDPSCLYHLKRYNRPYGPSSQKFFNKILN